MTNINLLPWREELREERKREFLITLVFVIAVAGVLLFLVDRYFNGEINAQNQRNAYLSEQISQLDSQIAEIRELQKQKTELTERMQVIQDLQGTRPVIVRLFDELVRSLPEGVYYSSIVRNGDAIQLEGVADSNGRVSALMRELNASDWFSEPDLDQVRADETDDSTDATMSRNLFALTVQITRPEQEEGEQE